MHGKLRGLYDLLRLAAFIQARHAFPSGIPIMDGSGFPLATRKMIEGALKDAEQWIRDEAQKPPLKMFLKTPDPHGTGGNSRLSSVTTLQHYDTVTLQHYDTATLTLRH